jgi:tRNA (Thr-GGU) A37 N-methylase
LLASRAGARPNRLITGIHLEKWQGRIIEIENVRAMQ